jgi:putative nucleotidyltransferase with HDIG domain
VSKLGAANPRIDLGRAAGVQFLRPFPLVARRLLELIEDEGMHLRELSRLLTRDAAFSSQVLRVANSALLGLRYEVTSLQQALSILGVQRLRALVVTVAMKNYMGRGGTAAFGGCWRHNLGTALWCEMLADCCNVEKAAGYTGGLLHDIGRLALLMLFPKDYALVMRDSTSRTTDNLEAERRFCDVDHCQMGHYLAESWNFPTALSDVIAHHHGTASRETPKLRLLVQAACTAANMSGFHAAGKGCAWEPDRMTDLLPPANARLLPPDEVMRERVTKVFNDIERGLG